MDYTTTQLDPVTVIGLKVEKTTNENNQAGKDISTLWERFFAEGIMDKIPNKLSQEMLGIYFDYEGDYTKPYSYMIGCKVSSTDEIPEGMESLTIPGGKFAHLVAKGPIPDSIMKVWREIWDSDIDRAYGADFEVYGAKSQDAENSEVDVYLTIK